MSSNDLETKLVKRQRQGYLLFLFSATFVLLDLLSHVFNVLSSLGERLQEVLEYTKEFVRLHTRGILAEQSNGSVELR